MTDISKSEFFEAVSKALEDDGTLNRIRSTMRAEVFRVVSGRKVPQCDITEIAMAAQLRETEVGMLCASLICDLLDHFGFKCTRSVFTSELGLAEDELTIDRELRRKLRLPERNGTTALYLLVGENLNAAAPQAKPSQRDAIQATGPDRATIVEQTRHAVDELVSKDSNRKTVSDFPDLARPRHSMLSDDKQLGDMLESLKIFSSGSNTGNSDGTNEDIKEEISTGVDAGDGQSSNESELQLSF
uniref:LisH domain-containing protein n=1 Tax=Trichuris muris TaxID=70415 RepID=A0A5S6QA44_TRIMR